jgi:hypothetical protein
MEEWQDPDSGYLNCIGVGDTYVRKQMERIFNRNILKSNINIEGFVGSLGNEIKE